MDFGFWILDFGFFWPSVPIVQSKIQNPKSKIGAWALAVALLLLAASCAKPSPPLPAQTRPPASKGPDDSADRLSLATLPRGATVTARTGELYLDTSAIRAIDGDPLSSWMSPPGDLPQTITIALPARSRIERVGIRSDAQFPANHVRFERSSDGTTFAVLTTIAAARTAEAQWFDVPPAEATHLRITVIDRTEPHDDVRLRSILARGTELEPPRPADVAGCWSVNGEAARFERRGAHAAGSVAMGRQQMHLDGGFDGRAYRFNWIRGNDYGYVLLSVSPAQRHLSAIEWHEEPIALFYGGSWFGERTPCRGEPGFDPAAREKFLRRTGRYSLFGIRFDEDGALDREQSDETLQWLVRLTATTDVQLVAHEFRRENAKANRGLAERELRSLRQELEREGANLRRVTFVAKGSDAPRRRPENEAMRVLYSAVDVEIRR